MYLIFIYQVEIPAPEGSANPIQKVEYRSWNPFRSKLAAAILGGVDNIHMGPGKRVSKNRYDGFFLNRRT